MGMYYMADIFLHIPWNAKHIYMFVEESILFDLTKRTFLVWLTFSLQISGFGKFALSTFWPIMPHR